ncbi:alpha/beta hydrolase [Rothia sp. LK2588]|uniref:alpha/beta fold hydrolase n=1 Tax=Rothia sp. LK2588 TaxID=3114369 RepID=UPI0034CD362D
MEYSVLPSGAPAAPRALLIHGFATCSRQSWEGTGWVRKLHRAGIDVILMDLPYHGREFQQDHGGNLADDSDQNVRSVHLDDENLLQATVRGMVQVLDEAADSLGNPQHPVHLIGFSAGARMAYEFAALLPHRTASLCLGGLPQHDELPQVRAYLQGASSEQTGESAKSSGPDGFLALQNIIDSSIISNVGLRQFAEEMPSLSFDPHSRTVQSPVLLVNGTEDTIAPSTAWLAEPLRDHGIDVHEVQLIGRDHVNALTSGQFKKACIDWMSSHKPTD